MPRDTQDPDQPFPDFAYGTLTLSGPPFQCGSAIRSRPSVGPPTPHQLAPVRFGLLRFRSPLLTESSLFLRVLRCFTSPSSPLRSYLFTTRCPGIPQGGFPHSDICGSLPYHNSPQLFAVVHVLPRPLAPRHPPYALRSLTCCVCARQPRSCRTLLTPTAVLLYPIQFLMCHQCFLRFLPHSRPGTLPPAFRASPGQACSTLARCHHTASASLSASTARLWACVDSNHGPLRYQHSALTV